MLKEGKQKIIDAAKILVAEEGIKGATIRSIAKKAEVSTGAIYHYYSSKEEILYDIMDESLCVSRKISKESRNKLRSRDEILDDICSNVLKRFNKIDENRIQFYLAQEAIQGDEDLSNKFKIKYKEWINETHNLIEELYEIQNKTINTTLASILIGAIDGFVMQLLLNANISSKEDVANTFEILIKKEISNILTNIENII